MATIKEVFDDVKDSVGDNGFMYLGIGFVALFVIMLLKDSSSGSDSGYSVATSYASYPDAVTNANVIIDSLQNSIDYSEKEIKDYIDENMEYTNNYMQEGFAKQEELSNKIYDSTMESVAGLQSQIKDVNTNVNTLKNTTNQIATNVANLNSTTNKIASTVSSIKTTVDSTNKTANNISKIVSNTSTKASTNTNTSTTKSNTKYMSTTYKGVSIVDGLKAGGYNSSYAYRQQLAKANGITNYTGTASQNTKLLNLLKQGKLKSA